MASPASSRGHRCRVSAGRAQAGPWRYPTLLPVLLALLLPACSSKPSAGGMEDYLRDRVESQSQGRLRLADFTTTNAQEGQLFGVPVYAVEYEATIEVVRDCYWPRRHYGRITYQTVAPSQMDAVKEIQGYRPAHEGTEETIRGSFTFEKTERGWKGPGGRFY